MNTSSSPSPGARTLKHDCTGHFFEQRFYSGALLTGEALIAAMAHVDLNPARAELAERIEEIRDTSICDRLQENSVEAQEGYLRPVVSGLDRRPGDTPSGVVAGVAPPVAGSTETPDLREAASARRPDGDGEAPPPRGSPVSPPLTAGVARDRGERRQQTPRS